MQTTAVFSEITNSNNEMNISDPIIKKNQLFYLQKPNVAFNNSNVLQIPNILLHHEGFLEDLKSRLENWDAKKTIGDWFLECVRMLPLSSYQRDIIYLIMK